MAAKKTAAAKTVAKKAAVKKAAPVKVSLRERLAAKRSRVTTLQFPIGEEGATAERELSDARQGVQIAKIMQGKKPGAEHEEAQRTAQRRVDEAQAKFDECSLTLSFRGLSWDEVDALQSEFAVADVEEGEESKFNLRGFTCALLAESVVDSDLTAEEWDVELYQSGRWSRGEVQAIREAARLAYADAPAAGIPKG